MLGVVTRSKVIKKNPNKLIKIINLHRHLQLIKLYSKNKINVLQKVKNTSNKFITTSIPKQLDIDVTNCCNFRCKYCYFPNLPDPQIMMSDKTIQSITEAVKSTPIEKIRLGGGEPTLHPEFISILHVFRKHCKLLTFVTNASWSDDDYAEKIIRENPSVIEVSIDAGGKEVYESSRINGNYDTLLHNLLLLKKAKSKLNAETIINARLMIRPSNINNLSYEIQRVLSYVDTFTVQKITKIADSNYEDDLFIRKLNTGKSTCYVPFTLLQISPDGKVPLCPPKSTCVDLNQRIYLGNIQTSTINQLWNHKQLIDIREAILTDNKEKLKICKNCNYS